MRQKLCKGFFFLSELWQLWLNSWRSHDVSELTNMWFYNYERCAANKRVRYLPINQVTTALTKREGIEEKVKFLVAVQSKIKIVEFCSSRLVFYIVLVSLVRFDYEQFVFSKIFQLPCVWRVKNSLIKPI